MAGAYAGLLPYTYLAARFTPILFLLLGLSFLLSWGRSKGHLRDELRRAGVYLGAAGLIAAPIPVHFALHPEAFFFRSNQLLILQTEGHEGDPLGAILENVWVHPLAFGFRGDPNWRHNFAGQPMLNPWEAFFPWLGVGTAVLRWKRPAYHLLLLWMAVLPLPAMLARDILVPNTLRMIGATPAVYLLAAVGVWEAFRFLRERFLRNHHSIAAIVLAAVVGGTFLVQGGEHLSHLFLEVGERVWNLSRICGGVGGSDPGIEPSDARIVFLIPDGQRHKGLQEQFRSPSFEYLYQNAAQVHLLHTAMPNLARRINATLAAKEKLSTVKVVDWDTNAAWTVDESDRFAVLFGKYGRDLDSDEYGSFQIHNYTDVALYRPWTIYVHLESLAVYYDGDIALQGIALG